MAPPQPLSAASICSSWLCISVLPSGVIAVRPTGRLRRHAQQSRTVAATVWSNRSRIVSFRLVQPRAPTMKREHGSQPRASNLRWPPRSQANPTRHRPVSKIQSNPRKKRASKVPSIREEDEPEKPEKPENAYDICREHLTKTRLSAGQGSRWESSGTIWGSNSIRHRLSLIRASAFVLLRGRHVNQTLMGGKGGLCSPTDALGSHRVHWVAVEALTIRSLARSTVQRSRHDAINIFFSSRYARLFA